MSKNRRSLGARPAQFPRAAPTQQAPTEPPIEDNLVNQIKQRVFGAEGELAQLNKRRGELEAIITGGNAQLELLDIIKTQNATIILKNKQPRPLPPPVENPPEEPEIEEPDESSSE